MPIRVQEVPGRSGDLQGRELKYLIWDTQGLWIAPEMVVDAVTAEAGGRPQGQFVPKTTGNGVNESTGLGGAYARSEVEVEEIGKGVYEVTVGYGPSNAPQTSIGPPAAGEFQYEFDIALEGTEVFYSRQTVSTHKSAAWATDNPGKDATDFGRAINVDKDGAKGTSILVPTAKFTLRYSSTQGMITEAYQRTVEGLVGSVNQSDYKGRQAGSLLFEGAAGRMVDSVEDRWEMTFSFRYRENRNVANGNQINIGDLPAFSMDGWDVLWVWSEDEGDLTASKPTRKPTFAYVERVYPRKNFALLGLP